MSNNKAVTVAPAEKQPGQMGGYAPYYDLIMALMTAGREKRLRQEEIRLSRMKPGDKVLEIGCGTGTLSIAMKAHVGPSGEVCSIDIAPEMVAKARRKAMRKGADVSIREGSISSIPFPDNRFDFVICSFMIFHMPDDVRQKGLSEIYRVLKPGGQLFVIDTEPLERLVPGLKERSFGAIEAEKTKFMYIGLFYLRAKAEKSRN